MLERFDEANVENLKSTCKAPWDVKDFSAMVPVYFLSKAGDWHDCGLI